MYSFVRDDSQYELVEYACHEGNNSMFNILTGARAKEAAGAGREQKPVQGSDAARE